jgi:hypothetical protein
MTARARVLLSSLAKDMDLSPADFDEAMEILQSGELMAARASDPQRARFREFLKRQLEELKAGILSARHEQTLLKFAVTQLAMDEEASREDLHAVAAEMGLKRVPLEEALRYVEELVAQKAGEETMVDRGDVVRLYHLARDWGLEPADVDDLVRYRLEDNLARGRREKLWNRGVIGGSITAAALVVLILAVLGMKRWSGTREPVDTATNTVETTPGTTPEPRRTKLPGWWDADLTIAISQVRNERGTFADVYNALIADSPERRIQGYELLVDHAGASPFDVRNWKLYEPVLIGCYALDPDDAAASQLRRRWLAVPQRIIDNIPATVEEFQAAIRPVASAARAIKEPRMPEPRSQALSDELGRLLHTPLDRKMTDADLQRNSLGGLALVLLEQIAETVEKRPEVLSRQYSVVAALARDRVAPEELSRHDATIAAAAIEHSPDNWRSWEAILQRGIESRDNLAVLRIVDAYDRCTNPELRKALEARLFTRLGITGKGLPNNQYAAAMRKALGASSPVDTSDAGRWGRLMSRASGAIEDSKSASNDPVALVKATANLAWNVNLAMALALPRPNAGQFDQWFAEGPPWEKKTDEDERPLVTTAPAFSGDRLNREQQDTFDRYLHELGDWQKLDEGRRVSYLRGIAQAASKVSDISPIHARQLASYLLGRKTEEEQTLIMNNAGSLRWKQLRIALADGIERSPLLADDLQRLMITFSGHEVPDIETNRAAARRVLLQSVVDELGGRSGDKNEAASDVDRWAANLASAYRTRAQLLGAGPAELDAASASSLLRIAVEKLPFSAKSFSSEASRLLLAADALGQSDAQRCVILQRSAIEQVQDEIVRRFPQRRAEAQNISSQFEQKSAAVRSVLPQLRDGESALLELWLLARPRGAKGE